MTIDLRLKTTLLLLADALVIVACQNATLLLLEQSYANSFTPAMSALAFLAFGWATGFYNTSISHVGISAAKLAEWMTRLQLNGVRHYGYYPDDFINDQPEMSGVRPAFSSYWYPEND